MRIVYMDEAGRGRMDEEPILVVAAAIIHPDTQWHSLRRHYADLANDVFDLRHPEEQHDEYVFHAMDVWHGSGDFPRNRFSLNERMGILARLSQIPALYGIPVCLGMVDKRAMRERVNSDKECVLFSHALAYAITMQHVDTWMDENSPGEVAEVKAEDTDEVKTAIDYLHRGSMKLDTAASFFDRGFFRTKNIVDEISFVPKRSSPLLQVGDHCAFLAKRMANKCPHVAGIWKNVSPQVQRDNKHEGAQILMRVPLRLLTKVD